MGVITCISPQTKNKERVNIYLDGRFACGMELKTVMENRLAVGKEIGQAQLEEMQFESEKTTALDKTLKHIAVSMKSKKQIELFLQGKGYSQSVIDYVLEKTEGYGFVNDEEFAAQYIRSMGKGKGKRLMAVQLKGKGISDDVAQAALSSYEGEEENLKNVLEKYLKNKPLDEKTLQKAFRYLMGKGFETDSIKDGLSDYRKEMFNEDNSF